MSKKHQYKSGGKKTRTGQHKSDRHITKNRLTQKTKARRRNAK